MVEIHLLHQHRYKVYFKREGRKLTVEELEEKLSFCEEDDEIKVVLIHKGKYITADIEDLEFYDDYIAVIGEGREE